MRRVVGFETKAGRRNKVRRPESIVEDIEGGMPFPAFHFYQGIQSNYVFLEETLLP